MPLEIRPGTILPIPCRSCGILNSTRMRAPTNLFQCKKCRTETTIVMRYEGERWVVWTSPADVAQPVRPL